MYDIRASQKHQNEHNNGEGDEKDGERSVIEILVAEKRRLEIERFLRSVFAMTDEIAHSDIIYTFFHPILRDQQEANIHERKLKLSLQYRRDSLLVMVHHARALTTVNGQEPSTYVKVYLRPDATKVTKRKTKVVRRSCHPSFMEMLEATVWSRDPLQENEFLGGVCLGLEELKLNGETAPEWYSLSNQ
ncbi:hypothetical protein B566_EDAN001456 [Ephemera danica]|nr:hypothetical protein B566_EDAN001456 [Ephemera danica]